MNNNENLIESKLQNYLSVDDLHDRWSGTIKKTTINQWRYLKKGPKFVKIGGRVLYREEDVRIFEAQNLMRKENMIQIEIK